MDGRLLLDLTVGLGALAGWLLLYGVLRWVTRPAAVSPAPATPELGAEPPAVVNLLVNRWSLTEDAAEATLLDLAARGFFEVRQPGADPMQSTVHLPAAPPDEAGLRPYERLVLDRVRGLAVDGVLPLTALTFRDEARARAWNKRLRGQVVADARAAGLSRRRFGPRVTALLVGTALVAAVVVGLAALHHASWHPTSGNYPFIAGIAVFVLLSTLAGASPGERDTVLGRQTAARWLGVRAWLRGHEQFDELPPAAVAIWDRYLGYGAAVGATHLASAVLDLGLGDRTSVWSSYGGTWRRVRVRYPRLLLRYGRSVPRLLAGGATGVAVGGYLLTVVGPTFTLTPSTVNQAARIFDLVRNGVVVLTVLVLLSGIHTLVRTLVDLVTERTVTGEVLWVEVWRSTTQGENRPARPWLHYLAVDDGTADRTTAWGLPSEWASRCHDGDMVTLRVRPWSRRVVELSVVGHGRSRLPTGTVAPDPVGPPSAGGGSGPVAPPPPPTATP
ncbi:DUF2207 domain-containing protein [Verrucosispora sp. SN26_14.1]|uniref:DUF2207 family protein n=1 Tax=Verrucosispora sp. SN26_14.1 TaxID=2527879 RepID=UPI0010350449|nr:DUF2207 domain-containing protein [Verrucosispora sp. SN26_14.1]TBL26555.1 DUF2207 domain-containing protein [Verrucosispora sp. SN26_14.1]